MPKDGNGHGDGGQAGVVILAEVADDGGGLVHSSGDEVGIFAVGGVPVTAVEYADGFIITGWKTLEVADEAMLVVDLVKKIKKISIKWSLHSAKTGPRQHMRTFNSGREDMMGEKTKQRRRN